MVLPGRGRQVSAAPLRRVRTGKVAQLRKVQATRCVDLAPLHNCSAALRRRVDSGKIPGFSYAVIHRGELLHSDSYGIADPKQNLHYSPDVLMRLYCMSKPFVAVAILILQERGKLNLRDPVQKFIPSFRQAKLASRGNAVLKTLGKKPRPFTILHCLTHTAGLCYGKDFNQAPDSPETKACHELVQRVEAGQVKSLAQFTDELAEIPLRSAPGKHYSYSYSVDVLGRVVEVVSGMSLGQFLEKEIFRPLGMKDTGFSFPKSKACRVAALYASRDSAMKLGAKASSLPRGKEALCRIDGETPEESRWFEGNRCPMESGGGLVGANMGGLVSTVNDSAKFVAMLSNGGSLDQVRILSEKSVTRWCRPDLLPLCITTGKQQRANGAPFGWTALGEVGIPRSARDKPRNSCDDFELGEVGGGGAACTYWSVNPSRDLAIVWFTQCMDNDPYVKDEENIYMAARKVAPLTKPPTLGKVRRSIQKTSHRPHRHGHFHGRGQEIAAQFNAHLSHQQNNK